MAIDEVYRADDRGQWKQRLVAGVYISYPFCNQKCTFCNFASDVGSAPARHAYHAALCREMAAHRWDWQPETLYLGGGTPSLLPPDTLLEILALIPADALTENTMECAPGTLTRELVAQWRQLGINRVSLGVQSFAEKELRQTGRRHTAETVEQDIAFLRAEGFSNFNLDLIAGLPHQTEASWEESLDWVDRLGAPHVSIYLFETDEDSRLGKELILGGERYGAAHVPSDDLAAQLYERACERLAAIGCLRYEVSNFARPGCESRHNLKYWLREPYVGFGLDAHSFNGRERWGNSDSLPAYLSATADIEHELVDAEEEHFFVGLRLAQGIEPTSAERARFRKPISKWTNQGLLIEDGATLRLSSRGILLSNEILQEFIHV